jgi:hypothetical protein
MKKRNLLPGFVLASLMVLGLAGTAHATSYTCDGGSNPVPASVTGDADIADDTCTISSGVTATGHIAITTSSGSITTGNLSGTSIELDPAGGSITTGDLTATSGDVGVHSVTDISVGNISAVAAIELTPSGAGNITVTGDITTSDNAGIVALSTFGSSKKIQVTGDITAPSHSVVLLAGGTIQAGTIDTSTGSTTHDIRIFPNYSGGSDLFVVGTSGTNGVTALKSKFASDNYGNVTVQNNGTGGIQVDGSAIDVVGTGGRSSNIVLDAGYPFGELRSSNLN